MHMQQRPEGFARPSPFHMVREEHPLAPTGVSASWLKTRTDLSLDILAGPLDQEEARLQTQTHALQYKKEKNKIGTFLIDHKGLCIF